MDDDELPYGFRRTPAAPPSRRRVWLAQRVVELAMLVAAGLLITAAWSGARDPNDGISVSVVAAPGAYAVLPDGDADPAPVTPLPVAQPDWIQHIGTDPAVVPPVAVPEQLELRGFVAEPSAPRRSLIAIWRNATLVAWLILLGITRRLLRRAQSDQAFTAAAVHDLHLLAWGTLVLGTLATATEQFAVHWLGEHVDAPGVAPLPAHIDLTPALVALLLFALAEVWRIGVQLRNATEGLV